MKQLITCPVCRSFEKKQILGEINDEGEFLIKRFHNRGYGLHSVGYTKIVGGSFMVKCGSCNQGVYFNNKNVKRI